jgi:hypothetical protein
VYDDPSVEEVLARLTPPGQPVYLAVGGWVLYGDARLLCVRPARAPGAPCHQLPFAFRGRPGRFGFSLAQDMLHGLFEELRGQFDYVILDSCPVLPVADSLLVAQHADGVILSILGDQSRVPRVHAAQQRLAALGARVLGAVVNGLRGDPYSPGCQNAMPTAAK